METSPDKRLVWALALGGYLPFLGLAGAILTDTRLPVVGNSVQLFLIWALAILTFLGGIRWGLAISKSPLDTTALLISVVPCIIGWFSFLLSATSTALVLGLLFLFQGAWDASSFKGSALGWFVKVRMVLTALVSVTVLAVAFTV